MKALVFIGGMRKKNTWQMARSLSEGLLEAGCETETIFLAEEKIRPCTGCEACRTFFGCVQKDAMQKWYAELQQADVVALATPLYFFTVSADTKAFMDRCQPFWERTFRRKEKDPTGKTRKGILLANHGGPFQTDVFLSTEQPVRALFRSLQIKDTLFYGVSDTDERPIEQRESVTEELYQMGKNALTAESSRIHRA